MKIKKVAIYVRCSTVQQNLDIQINDLRKYAEARGLEIVSEFSDFGISGAKDRRPALDQMMKSACQRKFDCVLVWRLDRLGRNTKHLLMLLDELESLQIPLVSLQEGFDLSTPIGRVVATVLAALSAFEREIIKERVVAGIQNAKANGKKLGRPSLNLEQEVRVLRVEGHTFREIQSKLKISPGTIAKYLK
ncbi:MAG: recombinase family protein [Bdellovibrionaceae bacterium]|nr:recombinase family protein [Pseudobdellovibrionaceae bacterium]